MSTIRCLVVLLKRSVVHLSRSHSELSIHPVSDGKSKLLPFFCRSYFFLVNFITGKFDSRDQETYFIVQMLVFYIMFHTVNLKFLFQGFLFSRSPDQCSEWDEINT